VGKRIRIDFTGVEKEIRSGSRAARVPEGDYLVKPMSAEMRKSENTGGRYLNWRFQIVQPTKYKGKTLYDRTSLKPGALWNLRNLIFSATGKNIAGKVLNFDPEQVYGKVLMVTVEDDEYNNQVRSQIVDYQQRKHYTAQEDAAEEDAAEEEDEDEDSEEEEYEEEDEEEDDDLDNVDVEEL
jgi:hypothetical protein